MDELLFNCLLIAFVVGGMIGVFYFIMAGIEDMKRKLNQRTSNVGKAKVK